MKRNSPALAAISGIALAISLLLAGCGTTAPSPTPTPTQTQTQAPELVVVAPKDTAAQPNTPQLYDTSQGSPVSDAGAPNGAVPPLTQSAVDQAVIAVSGLGAAPSLTYAQQSAKGVQPRFSPAQAVAVALAEAAHPSGTDWSGACEGFAGSYVWGFASSGWRSARDAVLGIPAKYKHRLAAWSNAPPAGAVEYWPDLTWGHAALSTGGSKIATTDFCQVGRVCVVPAKAVADKWFNGEKPWWIDPDYFPYAFGSNGVRAPTITPASNSKPGFPIRPGDTKKRVSVLKARFHWRNTSRFYGSGFAVRIERWQARHGFPATGVIGQRQYALTA